MSVSTACLIIEGDSLEGDGPTAFMPIAGTALIERVAHRLVAAGVEQIVLLAPASWPALKRVAAALVHRGVSAPIVRNVGDLADYIRADHAMLIVQDGILPSRQMVEDALARRDAVIYTRPVASSDDRHERIDIADRWAGLAVIPGSLVHSLDPQPDDWSAGSALLRRAVQHGVDRIGLDIARGSPRRADMMRGMADCRVAEQRFVDEYFEESKAAGNGLAASLGRWVARLALPHLWRREMPERKLGVALFALIGVTLLLAALGFVVAALLFGLASMLAIETHRHQLAFVTGRKGRTDSETGLIATLLLVAAVPVGTIATHGLSLTAISAGLIFPLSLFAAGRIGEVGPSAKWQFDRVSATLFVLLLVIVGIDAVPALLAASVICLILGFFPSLRAAVKRVLTP